MNVSVSRAGRTVTETPQVPLQTGAQYQVAVMGIADSLGNRTSASWRFSADPGRFAAPQSLLSGAPVTAVAIGDVNSDGRVDVVFGNGWLRQRAVPATEPPAPAQAIGGRVGRLGVGRTKLYGTR